MDIGKSFGYIFQDKDWLKKTLIGSAILMISLPFTVVVVGFLGLAIVSGYTLEVLRNVRQGSSHPLPEWRDKWSEWMVLGLKLWLALLVSLLMIVPSAMLNGDDTVAAVGGLFLVCLSCLVLLWSIVVLLASPAIYIRLAETERISSALQVGDILRFTRTHISDVIIATIMYLLASLVISLVGSVIGTLLCVIGLVVTLPAAQLITMLVQSHLYAQIGIDKSVLQSWAYGLPEPQPSLAVEPVTPAPADVTPLDQPLPPAPAGPETATPEEPSR